MKTQPLTTLQQNTNMRPTNWCEPFDEDTKVPTDHYIISQSFLKITQTQT